MCPCAVFDGISYLQITLLRVIPTMTFLVVVGGWEALKKAKQTFNTPVYFYYNPWSIFHWYPTISPSMPNLSPIVLFLESARTTMGNKGPACWLHFCLKLLSRDFCATNYPNHLFHLACHCACQSVKQYIHMSVGHVKYTPELSTGLLKHAQTWQWPPEPNHLFRLAGHCACQFFKQIINMSVGHAK